MNLSGVKSWFYNFSVSNCNHIGVHQMNKVFSAKSIHSGSHLILHTIKQWYGRN